MSALDLAAAQLERIKADVRELAAAVRAVSHETPLTPEQRSLVLYHLDHAREYGAPYSVAAAIRALREGA